MITVWEVRWKNKLTIVAFGSESEAKEKAAYLNDVYETDDYVVVSVEKEELK